MTRTLSDRILYGLSLVGILVVVHLWIMVGRGFDRGCFGFSEPTAFVECEAVIQSDAGTLFGISNAIWGLLFYLAMVGLSALAGLASTIPANRARLARWGLTAIGVVYSGYLVYVQATLIGSFCKLCVISAAIVAVLFLLASYDAVANKRSLSS